MSFIKIENYKGPKTEPCGTPNETNCASEKQLSIFICWVLSVRYEKHHYNSGPETPYEGNT